MQWYEGKYSAATNLALGKRNLTSAGSFMKLYGNSRGDQSGLQKPGTGPWLKTRYMLPERKLPMQVIRKKVKKEWETGRYLQGSMSDRREIKKAPHREPNRRGNHEIIMAQ